MEAFSFIMEASWRRSSASLLNIWRSFENMEEF
jgi:hypothetical protein